MDKYLNLIENAKKTLPDLEPIIRSVPYEEKGILYSEFLFMAACLYGVKINRILESGRARGQSTLLLAKTFSSKDIISIEYDKTSPDVAIANDRLKNYSNVTLKFGDSLSMMPRLVEPCDVVIIDGPKMFLALRLALKLLATGKVTNIFIHDVPINDPCRKFLDTFLPETLYSDHKGLAQVTHLLDRDVIDFIPQSNRIDGFEGKYGYGFTLGCIPYNKKRPYTLLYYLSFLYDLLHSDTNIWLRIKRKLRSIAK